MALYCPMTMSFLALPATCATSITYFSLVGGACASRNVFAGAVRTQDLRGMNALTAELQLHPCLFGSLSTLAMGDLQAVAIAQTCHLGLAIQHDIVRPGGLLTGKGPVPRGPDFTGIVIDDFVSLSIVPVGLRGSSVGAKAADQIEGVYKSVGLLPHDEKAERDQRVGQFWGVHLDGTRGHLRGSMKRAIPLANLAVEVARLCYASVELLQVPTRSFISLLL